MKPDNCPLCSHECSIIVNLAERSMSLACMNGECGAHLRVVFQTVAMPLQSLVEVAENLMQNWARRPEENIVAECTIHETDEDKGFDVEELEPGHYKLVKVFSTDGCCDVVDLSPPLSEEKPPPEGAE